MKNRFALVLSILALVFCLVSCKTEPKIYNVTFNANGTEGDVPSPITVAAGRHFIVPSHGTLSREGYVFDGWNTAKDGNGDSYVEGDEIDPVTANLTLYAVWKDDPLSYAYNDALGGWEVRGFKADAKDEDKRSVYIPFLHEGKPVKGIGELAFRSCDKLVAITMPQSVEVVGDLAFSECSNLSTVIMPGVVSIGKEAFIECSLLSNIAMPSGLKLLGASAFENCISITHLTIPTGVYSIGSQAFLNCSGLESIEVEEGNPFFYGDGDCLIKRETNELVLGCRNSRIPVGVQSIGASAFSGCSGLVGIDVPEGVESIGRFAFTSCKSLMRISLPQSLTSIGECAFYFCKGLVSIDYNGSMEQWKSLEKASNWDSGTKDYTIHCKDGEIVKSK